MRQIVEFCLQSFSTSTQDRVPVEGGGKEGRESSGSFMRARPRTTPRDIGTTPLLSSLRVAVLCMCCTGGQPPLWAPEALLRTTAIPLVGGSVRATAAY
jgi:hypothetical protein